MNSTLKHVLFSTLALGMALPSAVLAKGWVPNSLNDPNGFNYNKWHPTNYTRSAFELSKYPTGTVSNEQLPWGDTYWPSNRGGMAYRWKEFQKEDMDQNLSLEDRKRLFFDVKRYPRSELLTLAATNKAQYARVIDTLSALEKYALYVSKAGDEDYYNSDILNEFTKSKQAQREYWEGYCHAWAPVASHYAEPMPVKVTTKDGLEIQFHSADVKALLVANYQQKTSNTFGGAIGRFFNKKKGAQVRFVGEKCKLRFQFPIVKVKKGKEVFADYGDTEGLTDDQYIEYARKYQAEALRLGFDMGESPNALLVDANGNKTANPDFINQVKANMASCENTNAGAFHIVMVNQLGRMKEGFQFDKTRDLEVWNQPAFKYVSTTEPMKDVSGRDVTRLSTSAPGTASVLRVKTKLYYADDSDYGWTYSTPANLELFKVDSSPIQALIETFKAEYARYSKLLMNEGDESEALQYPMGVHDAAKYEYTLDVASNGDIIGGDWISFDRPDYLWIMQKEPFFDDFKRLGEIYQPISVPADQAPDFRDL